MPFGKHKDEEMDDLPAEYLDWLRGQDWIEKWPAVFQYLEDNRQSINKELGIND